MQATVEQGTLIQRLKSLPDAQLVNYRELQI